MSVSNPWPADKVERWPTDRLVPYVRNARTHSDAQIAQIAGSIREWGWTMPVLADEAGGLIAGHCRVLAARKLGLTEIPVMIANGWTEAQKRAYVIADNKLTLNAGWDADILKVELTDLKEMGADLSLVGFSEDELAALLADQNAGLTDPDDAPEPLPEPVSSLGDVWVLGRHRLVCGDSTDAGVVEKALNGVKPHLMVTDPPYGVSYDPAWRAVVNNDGPNSKRAVGKVMNDDNADWRDAWSLFPGEVAYVWHAGVFSPIVSQSLNACGFEMRALIVWAKQRHTFGSGHYHHMHEPCWYAVKKSGTGHWCGDHKQTTLWQINNNRNSETGHGTQKPVECMKRPIENNSSPGQAIYEPFSGSGTTVIAAEMTGRSCHAIELSPTYVDVAVRRWEAFTGQTAKLEATGQTFAETAEQRGVACETEPNAAAA